MKPIPFNKPKRQLIYYNHFSECLPRSLNSKGCWYKLKPFLPIYFGFKLGFLHTIWHMIQKISSTMPLTISTICFLAIMANNLILILTNLYFFKMIPNNRLFPIITTISNYLTHLGFIIRFRQSASALVGVAAGLAWATGVVWEGGASLEGSIT